MQWLLAALVTGFCGGVVLSDGAREVIPRWWCALWAVAWLLAWGLCARRSGQVRARPWPWLVAVGLGWGAWAHVGAADPERLRPAAWALLEEAAADLEGEVVEGSRVSREGRHVVTLEASRCDEAPCAGRWRVSLPAGSPWLRTGDRVWLGAVVFPSSPPEAEYLFDAARWRRGAGLVGSASVRDAGFVRLLEEGRGWRAWMDAGRQARERWAWEALGEERAGPVLAVLTGTKGLMSASQRAPVDAAGLSHLLAISGLHLMTLWAWLQRALRWVTRGRGPRWAPEVLCAALMVGYGCFVGWPVSAQRAVVMMLCWRGGGALGRRSAMAPSLSLAVLLVLLLEGTDALYGPGLQLSASAVVGLRLAARAGEGGWLRGALWVTLGSSAACAPWLALHFGRLPTLGLLLNLVAVPLVEFVSLPAAALAMLLGPGWAGEGLLWCSGWSLWLIEALAAGCPSPGASLGLASPWWVWCGLAAAAALLWAARPRLALLAVMSGTVAGGLLGAPPEAQVVFLPVGQGDAILVLDGEGRSLLMDTGGSTHGGQSPGARVIRPALLRRGVRRLDVVAISHADLDHVAGLEEVLREFRPAALWWSRHPEEGAREARLLALARELGVEVVDPPDDFMLGEVAVRRLDRPGAAGAEGLSKNDRSVVLEVTIEEMRVLLTGDVEAAGEALLLERVRPVHVLKAAHHGSRTSSTAEFLARSRPSWVVIQAGRGNRYGHPHEEVVGRYRVLGAQVWDGRECGEVRVWVEDGAMNLDSAGGCGRR